MGRTPEPTGLACQQSPLGVNPRTASLTCVAENPGREHCHGVDRVVQPHRQIARVEGDAEGPIVQPREQVEQFNHRKVGVSFDGQPQVEIEETGSEQRQDLDASPRSGPASGHRSGSGRAGLPRKRGHSGNRAWRWLRDEGQGDRACSAAETGWPSSRLRRMGLGEGSPTSR